jgi:uncharacterized protein DUF6159
MERIRRAFRLLGASWQVLKADRELLILPVVSFLAIVAVAVPFGLAIWRGGAVEDEGLRNIDYVWQGLYYFVAYFIGIFFNAAVVGAATIRLQGGDPTVSDGLRLAWSKVGKIAGWAVVAATVGLILHALEERAGFLGRIVIAIVGAAWSAITFFVVPVLLYEPVGVGSSIKRSASIFKQRWGETFVGTAAIGLAIILISIPVVVVIALIGVVSVPLAIAVGVLALGTLMAVGTALSGVFNAALYRYATAGQAGGAFSEADLQATFRPKGRRSGLT